MRALALGWLVVSVAACDIALGLRKPERPGDAGTEAADAAPDTTVGCVPLSFDAAQLAHSTYLAYELALDRDRTFAIVAQGTAISHVTPPLGPTVVGTGISSIHQRPASSPDGDRLFMLDGASGTVVFDRTGATTWSAPMPSGIPAEPGVPATSNGTLRMIVGKPTYDGFIEGRWSAPGSWQPIREYDRAALGRGGNARIKYPSLTADGLVLVFVDLDDGIYFIKRDHIDEPFDSTKGPHNVLFTGADLRSPHLDGDCSALWFVEEPVSARVVRARQ